MKLQPGRWAAFVKNPGAVRVVVLHGGDEGLTRQRAEALTVAVAGSLDDPFGVAALDAAERDRLEEEASAISMLGGRRVVRLRGVGDEVLAAVERVVARPGDSVVVLEAGALTGRSKLLAWAERSSAAAAVACRPPEGEELRGVIAAGLEAGGVRADAAVLDWLRDHLGGDSASTQGEIEKLILYAGAARVLDLEAVRACVGDQAASSVEAALDAALVGDAAQADMALERAMAEGGTAVGVIRVLSGHLLRLHAARGVMAEGASAAAAVEAMRPPVFFKRKGLVVRALETWSAARLAAAIGETRRAELACKQTGAPDVLLVRRLVLALARQAAGGRAGTHRG